MWDPVLEEEIPPELYPGSRVGPDDMFLGTTGRAAQIRYDEELRAIDSGAMQLNKVFTATSHEEPNVEVAKDYALRPIAAVLAPVAAIGSGASCRGTVAPGVANNGEKPGTSQACPPQVGYPKPRSSWPP